MACTSGVLAELSPLIFLLFQRAQIGVCGFISDEESLRSALLSNYSVKVRPDLKTNISINMFIASLNYLDIAAQSMSINIVPEVKWFDERLVWNTTDYGGLAALVTAPEDIWTPPLVVENAVNNVGVLGGKDRDATPVRITSTGTVTWVPPSEVSTSCEMLIAQYPFDSQTCSVIIIGWTYPLSEMNVSANGIDTVSLYIASGEFDLKSVRTYQSDVGGPAEETIYRKLYFEFTFRRKWQFYGQNLLMPIVLNSIMMNAVFALPIDSGEKMGYCLTVLLSYVVSLTWITENLPPVSTETSILQVYLATVLGLGSLATLLTTWVLHLYHTSPEKPIGPFYRKFASTVLEPFFILTKCSKKKTKDAQTDDLDPPHYVKKVTPVPSRPMSATSQFPASGSHLNGDIKPIGIADVQETFRSDDNEEERTRTYTWQELAALVDHLCLWVFGAALVILTTIILGLLHGSY